MDNAHGIWWTVEHPTDGDLATFGSWRDAAAWVEEHYPASTSFVDSTRDMPDDIHGNLAAGHVGIVTRTRCAEGPSFATMSEVRGWERARRDSNPRPAE